jgi:hydroxyacylglutathione hydrolase
VPENTLQIGRIESLPFSENTYVVHRDGRGDCIVIDPGFEPDAIIDYLAERSLTPAAILCTHGHSDHIAGNAAMKKRWPSCPLLIGVGDAEKLINPQLNLSAAFGFAVTSPPADRTLREGEKFSDAGIEFEIYDTPGHSIGHIVFVCKQTMPWQVFGGDVLFDGGIGRTDFPDGSFDALRASIHDKLFTLPDDTIVYPGHGAETAIGREKRTNPFVGKAAGYRL